MEVTTRPDRAAYRWMSLPEPAVVLVELVSDRDVDAVVLTVTCSAATRRVRAIGEVSMSRPDGAVVQIGALGAGQQRRVLLDFSPRPATAPGPRSIGSVRLDWSEVHGDHRVGRLMSVVVSPVGAARQSRDPRIDELLTERRGSIGARRVDCRTGTAD